MLLSSFAVFLVPFVSPGDPVRSLLRARMDIGAADEATVQAYAQQFGLHDPMLVQFGRWLGRFVTGDMGISHISGTPVADQVLPAIAVTLSLAGSALLVAIAVSIVLGVISATRAGSWPDRLITSVTHALIAIPEYALAPLLVLLFAVRWSLLPSAGFESPLRWCFLYSSWPCARLASLPSRCAQGYGRPWIQNMCSRLVPAD